MPPGLYSLPASTALIARWTSEIRIAADRRREVRVGLVGETEVADVVGPVARLLQRAQQHGLQQRVVGAILDPQQQLRVVGLAVGSSPPGSDSAQLARKSRSTASFSGVGPSCTR